MAECEQEVYGHGGGRPPPSSGRRLPKKPPSSGRRLPKVWGVRWWAELYAVRTRADARAARASAMYAMRYARLWLAGTPEGELVGRQFDAIEAAGGAALLGVAIRILMLAATWDRAGGRLIDHTGRPASPRQIAEALRMSLAETGTALRLLSRPSVGFLTWEPCGSAGRPIDAVRAAEDARGMPSRGESREDAPAGPAPPTAAGDEGADRQRGDDRDRPEERGEAAGGHGAGGGGPPGRCGAGGCAVADAQEQEQEQEQGQEEEAAEGRAPPAAADPAAPEEKNKSGLPAEGEAHTQGQGAGAAAREGQGGRQGQADGREAEADADEPTEADPQSGAPDAETPRRQPPRRQAEGASDGSDRPATAGVGSMAPAVATDAEAMGDLLYSTLYPAIGDERGGAKRGGTGGAAVTLERFRVRERAALASTWASVLMTGCEGAELAGHYAASMKHARRHAKQRRPRKTRGALWQFSWHKHMLAAVGDRRWVAATRAHRALAGPLE